MDLRLPPKAKFWKNRLIGQIYTIFFAIVGAVRDHILYVTTVNFGMRMWTWNSLFRAKFCKKNTLLGQIYTKNYQF